MVLEDSFASTGRRIGAAWNTMQFLQLDVFVSAWQIHGVPLGKFKVSLGGAWKCARQPQLSCDHDPLGPLSFLDGGEP